MLSGGKVNSSTKAKHENDVRSLINNSKGQENMKWSVSSKAYILQLFCETDKRNKHISRQAETKAVHDHKLALQKILAGILHTEEEERKHNHTSTGRLNVGTGMAQQEKQGKHPPCPP